MSMERTALPRRERSPVRVLAAIPDGEEREALLEILKHSAWTVDAARSIEEARARLRREGYGVVVCPYRSPGAGKWSDLLQEARSMHAPPKVVVTDELGDAPVWAEVISLGGYDLLQKPFEPGEVFQVLSLAWLAYQRESTALKRIA